MNKHILFATSLTAVLLTASPAFADSNHRGFLNLDGSAKIELNDADNDTHDSGIGAQVRLLAQQNASTSGGIGAFVRALAHDVDRHDKNDKDKNDKDTSATSTATAHITGTVTAVSGSTLTVSGQNGAVYTVNAGSATIKGEGSVLADIKVGDKVTIKGTLSGSVITATTIEDRTDNSGKIAVSGTVTAISGSTITLAGKNGATYTVNAGSAAFSGGATGIGSVKVGDTVSVRGTLAGSVITATSVVDKSYLRNVLSTVNNVRAGIVSALTGSGFTLTGNGTTTVITNASTTVLAKGGATTTGAIQNGSNVLVLGTTSTSTPDTITASIVILFQQGVNALKHFFVR